MAQVLISATHKSSGKTTVSLGLCAALARRGLAVQPFKKGPDYIDPMWLTRAAGRPCRNLDFHTMSADEIRATVASHARDADIAVIEGNKGLHDGMDLEGADSNAALARLLGAPVILVIDCRGMTRGVAPLLLGFQAFDPALRIAGVILNQCGGPRHEAKLRAVVEHYTGVPVLGALARDPALAICERHLGLIPSNEAGDAAARVGRIGDIVADAVDLDRLLAIAASAAPCRPRPMAVPAPRPADLRIGIARDAAFGFYYPGDLEAFATAGAELVPFDSLRDARLPAVDGLFLGGGFPEIHMQALSANTSLRRDIHLAVEAGLPVYAECGGLMYLSRRITWGATVCDMVGALPADAVMHERPVGRGYVRLRETGDAPWRVRDRDAGPLPGHEFHHSALTGIGAGVRFAYDVLRGAGIDGQHDGLLYKNVLASYAHLHHTAATPWVHGFVGFVRDVARQRAGPPLLAIGS